jgi:hypothetical protein
MSRITSCPACPADTLQNLRFCWNDSAWLISREQLAQELPRLVLRQRPRGVLWGIERDTLHRAPPCGNGRFLFTGSVLHCRQRGRAFITPHTRLRTSKSRSVDCVPRFTIFVLPQDLLHLVPLRRMRCTAASLRGEASERGCERSTLQW